MPAYFFSSSKPRYLAEAPVEMMISGLGDMLAKYVSICEWRISNIINGEYYCEDIGLRHARIGFRQQEMTHIMENIIYNDQVETYSANNTQIWKDYLNNVYENNIPDELYLVTGQWNAFVDTFVELGYEVTPVVDTTAKLYKMTKK